MNPNETSARPDTPGVDRREFLRLSGTVAAAGALASAPPAASAQLTLRNSRRSMPVADGRVLVSF